MNTKSIKQTFSVYAITFILSILILTFVMELWRADFEIPFTYGGDAIFSSIFIKGMIENGWYLYNPYVGAPFGLYLQDFPMAENFTFLLMKIISLFTQNYAVVLNLFYLFTFPLTSVTSVFVFRRFNISNTIAIVFALLYSFLPYHFFRGQNHIFLAAYYMIPLITLIVLWVWSEKPLFYIFNEKNKKFEIDISSTKTLFCIFVCLIVGSTGVYYAFFASFFIIIAGLSNFLSTRNRHALLSALILVIIISATIIGNIFPSIIYNYNNGPNTQVAQRNPVEAEVYGLKIIYLFLPVEGHRLDILNKITQKYQASKPPLQNENSRSSLGFIGAIGFLALVSIILFSYYNGYLSAELFTKLATLNISAVLFATIGGFGSIFAFFISPQIRGYNRLSIFIAFFSLFALALFLHTFQQKYIKTNRQKRIFYFGLILVLIGGIYDQTTKHFIPQYATVKDDFLADKEFVETIEKNVPENSMIFQLPYMAFPESPPINNLGDYQLFRGYLHSTNLLWSYGAMKGRNGNWYEKIISKPIDDSLTTITLAGFSGIYIDRNGYTDRGAEIEAQLVKTLKINPIVSKNNRLVFFNMKNYNASVKEKYTAAEIEDLKQRELYATLKSKTKNKSELILRTIDKDVLLHIGFQRGIIGNGVLLEPLSLSQNFTLEVILKPFRGQVPYAGIIGNHPGYKGYEGFVIQQDNKDQNMYNFGYANGTEWLPGVKFKLNEDKWNYLVVVKENNIIRVYIDGISVTSINAKSSIKNSEMPLYVGNWIGQDRPFSGLIEEVRIMNGSIYENEIVSNMKEIQEKLEHR